MCVTCTLDKINKPAIDVMHSRMTMVYKPQRKAKMLDKGTNNDDLRPFTYSVDASDILTAQYTEY